jgi:hypothetical protein
MNEQEKLKGILSKIIRTEDDCSKVQTTNMKYIIIKDAMLIIKQRIEQYIEELENQPK